MFGWLRSAPKCPVDLTDKVWIEQRFAWLIQKFGVGPWRELRVVLPTEEFFPERFNGSEADVAILFRRVAAYMGVRPDRVELGFADGEGHADWQDTAGTYLSGPPERITLKRSALDDPQKLVAVCAHELAHAILLGDQWLTDAALDHEFVTDLLTVFCGVGVFAANSAVREKFWSDTGYHNTQYSRLGYLSERAFGYAFALFCWLRNEENPEWLRYLRPNVRAEVQNGLRFLTKTGDSLLTPSDLGQTALSSAEWTLSTAREELASPSASSRLAMIWALRRRLDLARELFPELQKCLNDEEPQLAAEVIDLFCRIGPPAKTMVPVVLNRSAEGNTFLRSIAARLVVATEDASLSTAVELQLRLRSSLHLRNFNYLVPPTLPGVGYAQTIQPAEEELHALRNFSHGVSDEALQRDLLNLLKDAVDSALTIAEQAVDTLRLFGPRAIALIDDLLNLLEHCDHGLAPHFYQMLCAIAPEDPRVLDVLLQGLCEEDPQYVAAAVESLAQMGKFAEPAIPELQELLASEEPVLRFAAADALARIGGQFELALEIYRAALPFPFTGWSEGRAESVDYDYVAKSLHNFGQKAIGPLMQLGAEAPEQSRCFAAWGLGIVAADTSAAREWLRECLHGDNPVELFLATAALVSCGGDPIEVAHKMMDLMTLPIRETSATDGAIDRLIRSAARRFLLSLGRPSASAALERLASSSSDLESIQSLLATLLAQVPNIEDLEHRAWLEPEPLRSRFAESAKQRDRLKQEIHDSYERSRSVPPLPEREKIEHGPSRESIVTLLLLEMARLSIQESKASPDN